MAKRRSKEARLTATQAKPEDLEDVTGLVYPELAPSLERGDIAEMDVLERKRRLSRFARENIYNQDGRPHRMPAIQSIMELNKMDGSYAPLRHQHQHVVFEVVTVDYTRQVDDTQENLP
jgi:hypothetical protein